MSDLIEHRVGSAIILEAPLVEPSSFVGRHISRGSFFDRFGPLKWDLLANERRAIRAVITDASVRTSIDLDDPQLPAGLAILQSAGHEIDPTVITGAPVRAQERP
jgi:hypothetical protein